MKKGYICTFITILFSLCLTAQNSDSIIIKKIADEIMTNGKAYDNLHYLCKQIGARLSGSANAQKAVLATAKMLKDAGADTVYLQPCRVTHWVRGVKETGYIKLADGTKYNLKLCALGNSVATGKNGLICSVIEINNFKELDRLGEEVIKGKIVFYNFPMNPTYIGTFNAYGECWDYRGLGPARAAKYGAVGVMLRSLASNIDEYPHTGTTIYNDSFPKIPAVAISTKDAEWLSLQLKKKMQLTAYFKTGCMMYEDAASFNVIGEICQDLCKQLRY